MKFKMLFVVMLMAFLSACGYQVDYKSDGERAKFTNDEIHEVEQKILNMDGVTEFSIKKMNDGFYGVLHVEEGSNLKELTEESFYSMKRETTEIVNLFVKTEDGDNVLAQVFKPRNSDLDDEWIILFE